MTAMAGGGFGFIREAPRALQASKPGVWHPGVVTAQLDLAAHRQLEWRQWWCRQPSRHRDTAARLDKLAQSAREHPLQAITSDQVTEALYSFKDQTGQSLDRLGPRHFKHLPPAAHQERANLIVSARGAGRGRR